MNPRNFPNSASYPQQPASGFQQTHSQSLPVNKRFRSTAGLTLSGALMAAAGGVGVFVFGILELFGLAAGLISDIAGAAAGIIFGTCLLASAILLGFGIRNLKAASAVKSFRRIFGNYETLTLDFLAAQLHTTPEKALSQARKLLKRGCIPQGHIDDQNTMLMVTESAYQQHRQMQQSHYQMLETQRAAQEAQAAQEAERLAREEDLASRLTAQQREFVSQVRGYLKQLRALDERIDDPMVSEHITTIEDVLSRILARAEEKPEVISGLDMLTTYYLPTITKLLDAYDGLEEQPVQGDNISTSRREIESTLDVVQAAFEKMLDATYQDLSIDVSTDVSVLHAMLAREGLTDSPFDMKP